MGWLIVHELCRAKRLWTDLRNSLGICMEGLGKRVESCQGSRTLGLRQEAGAFRTWSGSAAMFYVQIWIECWCTAGLLCGSSVVGTLSRLRVGRPGVWTMLRASDFLFLEMQREALETTWAHIQWSRGISSEVKRPGRDFFYSHRAPKLRMYRAILHLPVYACMCVLIFSITFFLNISHFEKNSARYKCTCLHLK
jgi:hypothetical protein